MSDANAEQWLPVPGFEGLYEVSSHGRTSSLGDRIAAILADHHNDPDNYDERCLCGNWRWRSREDGSWEAHVAAVLVDALLVPQREIAGKGGIAPEGSRWLRYVTDWIPDES